MEKPVLNPIIHKLINSWQSEPVFSPFPRKYFFGIFLFFLTAYPAEASNTETSGMLDTTSKPKLTDTKRTFVPFDISLIPSLNLMHVERKTVTGLSFNVLSGRAAAIYGIELGGLENGKSRYLY
jgi:hypothetical protein